MVVSPLVELAVSGTVPISPLRQNVSIPAKIRLHQQISKYRYMRIHYAIGPFISYDQGQ
jgi:hypothetical protein